MEIDVKNCPCYIDRPLHRYYKGCLIQSQAFSEQQTKEKPILRCDEIVGCPIKEQYKQLQQLKAENEELKEKLKEVQKFLERYEVGECNWNDDCYYCKNESKDGKYFCNIGNALEVIRGKG